MIAAHAALVLSASPARTAWLAAGHALVVGLVAWYVVDAVWGSTPVSASLPPVPVMAFVTAWVAGTIYLMRAGPMVGAASVRGPFIGPDPTAALPLGRISRAAAAWA